MIFEYNSHFPLIQLNFIENPFISIFWGSSVCAWECEIIIPDLGHNNTLFIGWLASWWNDIKEMGLFQGVETL